MPRIASTRKQLVYLAAAHKSPTKECAWDMNMKHVRISKHNTQNDATPLYIYFMFCRIVADLVFISYLFSLIRILFLSVSLPHSPLFPYKSTLLLVMSCELKKVSRQNEWSKETAKKKRRRKRKRNEILLILCDHHTRDSNCIHEIPIKSLDYLMEQIIPRAQKHHFIDSK